MTRPRRPAFVVAAATAAVVAGGVVGAVVLAGVAVDADRLQPRPPEGGEDGRYAEFVRAAYHQSDIDTVRVIRMIAESCGLAQ